MITKTKWVLNNSEMATDKTVLERILEYKGITEETLKNSIKTFHDATKMNDMSKAVERIVEAVENGQRIAIHGDYDADGIMATTIMVKALKELGADCFYVIPNRLTDGYGLSETTTDIIIAEATELVITVDCGITSHDEIEALNEMGIDVIVTDHHLCKDTLPNALAVIDCHRDDNEYPFEDLCGAGVAYKVMQAVYKSMGIPFCADNYIQYAAIATIADVVPLVDENRAIVYNGIEAIKRNPVLGIEALLKVTEKLDTLTKLTAQDIAFYLAPLINAASRVGDVEEAMELMTSASREDAWAKAGKLLELNNYRKAVEAEITSQATEFLMRTHNFNSSDAIIVYGTNWHSGVIGIVAAKLAEQYGKPAIILSTEDGVTYHGSCRTYGDVDIMQMLNHAESHISKYGGHAGAAGLTICAENIEHFINACNEFMKTITVEKIEPVINIDAQITSSEITIKTAEDLQKLQPFGKANAEPIFVCKTLKTKSLRRIGTKAGSENAHLKITFTDRNNPDIIIDGIGFFLGDYADVIGANRNVNVVFTIGVNEWRGKKTPQIIVKEIRFANNFAPETGTETYNLYDDGIISLDDVADEAGETKSRVLPTPEEYVKAGNAIKALLETPCNEVISTTLELFTTLLSAKTEIALTPFKTARILATVNESGFIEYRKSLFEKIIITKASVNKPKIRISMTQEYLKDHNA